MLTDPTKREMKLHLGRQWKKLLGPSWEDDAEIAIYWYANDYHGGQFSNLYSTLSTSPYNPGPYSTKESEGGMVAEMYADLESQFGKVGE